MTSNELSALFEALLALIDNGNIDKVKEILAKHIKMDESGMTDMQFRAFLLLLRGNLESIQTLYKSDKHNEAEAELDGLIGTLSERINDLQ